MKGIPRLVALLVAAAGLLAGIAVQAAAFVPPSGDLTVYGKGYGHGRGMSQYGAQGAAMAGLTARQILDFYYPGTSAGTTKGYVRVWTTADTSPGVYVRPAVGLRARSLKTNTAWTLPRSSTITAWILAPYGEHQTRLSYYRSTSRTWVLWKTLAGMGQFEGRYESSVVTMVMPNGSTATYRGRLRTADRAGTDLDTLNVLTMEYYLQGVVPKEAITTWRPAALQAQAIAARTYAASQVGSHNDYDLCDTVTCQVYGGYAAEVASTNAAVVATSNQIRTYAGKPILAQFSSSNGGYTAPGDRPYLIAKPDPYDGRAGNGNPNSNWTVSLDRATTEAKVGVGTIEQINVLARNGYGTWGGRVLSVEIRGTAGTKTFSGDELRFLLGLKSTWIQFEQS